TARALNSSSYFFGMMRTTFPRKKVCIELGAVQIDGPLTQPNRGHAKQPNRRGLTLDLVR
ncbi:hypothetical protein, partial [Mycobacterium intracellulare]